MTRVMAVEFERFGPLHYLDAGEGTYAVGDWVRFPTPDGVEVAKVVWAAEEASAEGLEVCLGVASEADLARDALNRRLRAEGAEAAKELIAQHGLPMKVVGVDYLDSSPEFDRMFAIYYTAPTRVDFRALLGDLARRLSARIDLRQVGSRDAARLVGGLGVCGRELCCVAFLNDLEPVSMRLARRQGQQPNPLQLIGQCGRMKCCLKFEQPCPKEDICSSRGRPARPRKGAYE